MNASAVTVRLANARGLHARASAKFSAVASSYEAEIWVTCADYRVSALSIMGLMMLGAGIGDDIEIAATGEQAAEAIETLARLVVERFGEKE